MSRVSLLDERLARQIFRRRIDLAAGAPAGPSLLFDYEPGDVISGETFSRASTAYQTKSDGTLELIASGVKRDAHYIGGLRHVLVEPQRTNLHLRSQEFENAAWGLTVSAIVANATNAPDGTATADKLTETGPSVDTIFGVYQTLSITANLPHTSSVFAKAGEITWLAMRALNSAGAFVYTYFNLSTGTIGTVGANCTARITPYANGWYRCEVTSSPNNTSETPYFTLAEGDGDNVITTASGASAGLYLWGAQYEQGAFATTYIPTAGSSVSRAADNLKWPISFNPQELTMYAKWTALGAIGAVSFATVATIGNTGGAGTEIFGLMGSSGAGPLSTERYTGVEVNSVQSVLPSFRDVVEGRAVLRSTGAVINGQSLNGAAETLGAESGTPAISAAWSADFVYAGYNDAGFSSAGNLALSKLKIIAGVKTLAEMRAL